MTDSKPDLRREFREVFGDDEGVQSFFAPGRVNLIGEHIDYNGGYVLPCTINRGIWAVARPRQDRLLRVVALDFVERGAPRVRELSLDALEQPPLKDWSAYLLGMLSVLKSEGHVVERGLEVVFSGNLPIANGLSSSHALMVLFGLVLIELNDLPLRDEEDRRELALLTQKVENHFIGVQSGIMDGFVIAVGAVDEALLLRCSTLEYQRIRMRLPKAELWIIDSKMSRELSSSAYNQRFAECGEALRLINQASHYNGGVFYQQLADLGVQDWTRWQVALADPVIRKRGCHVISENLRVPLAAEALQSGEMERFGELLSASHRSLRDHYEVTGPALDALAELCWRHENCLGARMTGAGFGGCFIALFKQGRAETCLEQVAAGYRQLLGLDLEAFPYRGGVAGTIHDDDDE